MEKKIIRLKEVDSTNAFLKNLDTNDEDALTIAVADYQTSGRGQGVHTWESEPGKNLVGKTVNLDVHLCGGDAVLGAGYLEVHITEVILVAENVGKDGVNRPSLSSLRLSLVTRTLTS